MRGAIDRFRERRLRTSEELHAEAIAQTMVNPTPAFLFGYLESAVAEHLDRPRWSSRSRLAIDLRAVQIAWERRSTE